MGLSESVVDGDESALWSEGWSVCFGVDYVVDETC